MGVDGSNVSRAHVIRREESPHATQQRASSQPPLSTSEQSCQTAPQDGAEADPSMVATIKTDPSMVATIKRATDENTLTNSMSATIRVENTPPRARDKIGVAPAGTEDDNDPSKLFVANVLAHSAHRNVQEHVSKALISVEEARKVLYETTRQAMAETQIAQQALLRAAAVGGSKVQESAQKAVEEHVIELQFEAQGRLMDVETEIEDQMVARGMDPEAYDICVYDARGNTIQNLNVFRDLTREQFPVQVRLTNMTKHVPQVYHVQPAMPVDHAGENRGFVRTLSDQDAVLRQGARTLTDSVFVASPRLAPARPRSRPASAPVGGRRHDVAEIGLETRQSHVGTHRSRKKKQTHSVSGPQAAHGSIYTQDENPGPGHYDYKMNNLRHGPVPYRSPRNSGQWFSLADRGPNKQMQRKTSFERFECRSRRRSSSVHARPTSKAVTFSRARRF